MQPPRFKSESLSQVEICDDGSVVAGHDQVIVIYGDDGSVMADHDPDRVFISEFNGTQWNLLGSEFISSSALRSFSLSSDELTVALYYQDSIQTYHYIPAKGNWSSLGDLPVAPHL